MTNLFPTRWYLSKYEYEQEYSLVDKTQKFHGYYMYSKPNTKHYISKTNRVTKVMHHILDFIPSTNKHGWYLCKKPLDAYLIRELIQWCSKAPSVWMKYPKLLANTANYIPSYDQSKIDLHIKRQQNQRLAQEPSSASVVDDQSIQTTELQTSSHDIVTSQS